jgi:gliding motility-associated-like protein
MTVSGLLAGNYNCLVTDAYGCTSSGSATVNEPLQVVITGHSNAIVCSGQIDTLNVSASGGHSGYNFNWVPHGPVINITSQTNYLVTAVDSMGCSSSLFQITVNPILGLTPLIDGPTTLCNGNPDTLSILNSNLFQSITWSNGIFISENIITAPGIYSVSVIDSNGCNSSAVINVLQDSIQPVISGDTLFCIGQPVILNAGSGYSNYHWSTGETTQSIVTYSPGTFLVSVIDVNGCDGNAFHDLNVYPTPSLNIHPSIQKICLPDSVEFINHSNDFMSYSWDFGDGVYLDAQQPFHQYSTAGIYTLTLTAVSIYGCLVDTVFPDLIEVSDRPLSEFSFPSADFVQFPGTNIQFNNLSMNYTECYWYSDNKLIELENDAYAFSETGLKEIKLICLNDFGCSDTSTKQIFISPVYIPNSFTPNGDGLNDIFIPVNYAFDHAIGVFSVYNRWGERVYHQESNFISWNGTVRSQLAPEGVYTYIYKIVFSNSQKMEFEGRITLIR